MYYSVALEVTNKVSISDATYNLSPMELLGYLPTVTNCLESCLFLGCSLLMTFGRCYEAAEYVITFVCFEP